MKSSSLAGEQQATSVKRGKRGGAKTSVSEKWVGKQGGQKIEVPGEL
jgi:hypothetical protein